MYVHKRKDNITKFTSVRIICSHYCVCYHDVRGMCYNEYSQLILPDSAVGVEVGHHSSPLSKSQVLTRRLVHVMTIVVYVCGGCLESGYRAQRYPYWCLIAGVRGNIKWAEGPLYHFSSIYLLDRGRPCPVVKHGWILHRSN